MIKKLCTTLTLFASHIKIVHVQKCCYSSLIKVKPDFKSVSTSSRSINKRVTSKKLQELLNMNQYKASSIISKGANFNKISAEELEKNYKLCLNYGLSTKTIEKYPNILADSALIYKLDTLKLLSYDINITAPLISFNLKKLKGFVYDEREAKRLEEYAKLFQVNVNEVCKLLSTKQFLTSIKLDQVKQDVNILLKSGVAMQSIINDLWVLRYSPNIINERIKWAKENDIENIKTWMIRAKKEISENYVKRRSDNKEILGDKHDLVEYLSEKLECSSDVSKYLISKHPALEKKSLRKMREMIDYLLANGFKPIHICRTPKILLHSVETIRKRLKELEDNNLQLDSLNILTKSQRQYMCVFDNFKSNKGKLKTY